MLGIVIALLAVLHPVSATSIAEANIGCLLYSKSQIYYVKSSLPDSQSANGTIYKETIDSSSTNTATLPDKPIAREGNYLRYVMEPMAVLQPVFEIVY